VSGLNKIGRRHLFIPDVHCKPETDKTYLQAIGNLIVDMQPDVVVHIGDHWDMASLSSYEDRGSAYFHDKTYAADVEAGIEGMKQLLGPLRKYQQRRTINKKKKYDPRLVFCLGNHEHRIARAVHKDPRLQGTVGYHSLELDKFGWETHDFLDIVEIDGILYSHYFVNPLSLTKNPLSGNIENRLQKVGQSFSQGHQQVYQHGMIHDALGRAKLGLVWGTCYQHNEDYLGPQGNARFDGVMLKNEVREGFYCGMPLSLQYLKEKYL